MRLLVIGHFKIPIQKKRKEFAEITFEKRLIFKNSQTIIK